MPLPSYTHPALPILAQKLVHAQGTKAVRIFMMGAHVIRAGVSRYLIDMMQRGLISHIAMNGAGPIHDWELALIGATTESVAHYIQTGEFGLWKETGQMNDAIVAGAQGGLGLGEALGRAILNGHFPNKDVSILAAGVRLNVPVTVHVGIGYDIIHEHANCDGAALGQTSYQDFLIFTQSVAGLEGGVLLSVGSAVMGPEIYLKALSMARNVAFQQGHAIRHFTTGVFDLMPLARRSVGDRPQDGPALLLPAVEDNSGAHRRRRGRKSLRRRRSSPDRADTVSRSGQIMRRSMADPSDFPVLPCRSCRKATT